MVRQTAEGRDIGHSRKAWTLDLALGIAQDCRGLSSALASWFPGFTQKTFVSGLESCLQRTSSKLQQAEGAGGIKHPKKFS